MVAATFFACSKEKTAQRETTIEQQPKSPNDYTLAEMAEAMSWEDGKAFFENQTVKDYTAVCEMVLNDFGILFQFIFVYYLILQNKQKIQEIMTIKTLKNIRICCFVALAFCLVWAVSIVANFIVNVFGNAASSHPIDWSQNTFMKVVVILCYVIGTIAMIGICVKVVINTMRGLREDNAFPRNNEKLLFWIGLVDFVRLFGAANVATLWDDNLVLALAPENFVTPFFLLFFAFMYKVAADAVEENNLTV